MAGAAEDGTPAASTGTLQTLLGDIMVRVLRSERFKGSARQIVELASPEQLAADRLCLIGLGAPDTLDHHGWERLGGALAERFDGAGSALTLAMDAAPENLAHLVLGLALRGYRYEALRTGALPDDEGAIPSVEVHDPDGAVESA